MTTLESADNKIGPTIQMPRKDCGMQQLPQNRTLRESVPQQNRQWKKTLKSVVRCVKLATLVKLRDTKLPG